MWFILYLLFSFYTTRNHVYFHVVNSLRAGCYSVHRPIQLFPFLCLPETIFSVFSFLVKRQIWSGTVKLLRYSIFLRTTYCVAYPDCSFYQTAPNVHSVFSLYIRYVHSPDFFFEVQFTFIRVYPYMMQSHYRFIYQYWFSVINIENSIT